MALEPSNLSALLAANAVRSIGIVHRGDVWEVWVHAGPTLADAGSEPIHTTRGLIRQWSTLDAAYGFVRTRGYHGTVGVDDGSQTAQERTLAADTAETLPASPRAAEAVSEPLPPATRKSTRSPLVATPSAPSATTKTTARPGRGPGRLTKDD